MLLMCLYLLLVLQLLIMLVHRLLYINSRWRWCHPLIRRVVNCKACWLSLIPCLTILALLTNKQATEPHLNLSRQQVDSYSLLLQRKPNSSQATLDVKRGDKAAMWQFLDTVPGVNDYQRAGLPAQRVASGCTFTKLEARQCGTGESGQPKYNITITNSCCRGGMGNRLFRYATLYAASRKYNMDIVLSNGDVLEKTFNLSSARFTQKEEEEKWYNYSLPKFPDVAAGNVHLQGGYMLKYVHFEEYTDELRREIRFLDDVRMETSRRFLAMLLHYHKPADILRRLKMYPKVGLHIRRGDNLYQSSMEAGHTVAPLSYIQIAMDYFRLRYTNVTFIVISDDMDWARAHLARYADVIYFNETSNKGAREETDDQHRVRGYDMYLMSTCEHMIVTVGTFGWWCAFLGASGAPGGEVTYYRNYPPPGSPAAKDHIVSMYYPPHWIPLGDEVDVWNVWSP